MTGLLATQVSNAVQILHDPRGGLGVDEEEHFGPARHQCGFNLLEGKGISWFGLHPHSLCP